MYNSRYDEGDDRGSRSTLGNAPQSFQQRVMDTLMRVLFISASIVVLAFLVFVGLGIWRIWPFVWDHLWILGIFAVGVVAYSTYPCSGRANGCSSALDEGERGCA